MRVNIEPLDRFYSPVFNYQMPVSRFFLLRFLYSPVFNCRIPVSRFLFRFLYSHAFNYRIPVSRFLFRFLYSTVFNYRIPVSRFVLQIFIFTSIILPDPCFTTFVENFYIDQYLTTGSLFHNFRPYFHFLHYRV